MGTSASVSGAGHGVPLVPSWVDDIDSSLPTSKQDANTNATRAPISPKNRLGSTRLQLGKFAKTGDEYRLRSAVGNYVRNGRGGSSTATRRSTGAAKRGAALIGIVGGSPVFKEVREGIRQAFSKSGNSELLIAAIASAASPNDGTLDSEIGLRAASEAMQYVLVRFPEADLFDLDATEREVLLERYLAFDCYGLFMSENGKHIQSKVDLDTHMDRVTQIKNFFCEVFRQANQSRREKSRPTLGQSTDADIARICKEVIRDAYNIFEGFLDEA